MDLQARIRSAAPNDVLGMAFDNGRLIVQLYVTAEADRTAIRRCARGLGIKSRLRMTIHRWTSEQKSAAAQSIVAALPDLFAADLFDVSQSVRVDGVTIDVWQAATDDDVERIRQAAAATGIPFTIDRRASSRPHIVAVPA
jgi:hypothetical protein